MKRVKILGLQAVSFRPHLPALNWQSAIAQVECDSCSGLSLALLRPFVHAFADSLEAMRVSGPELRADPPAMPFALPHLEELHLTSDQPLDLVELFRNSLLRRLELRRPPRDLFDLYGVAPRAVAEPLPTLQLFKSTLKVFKFQENLELSWGDNWLECLMWLFKHQIISGYS